MKHLCIVCQHNRVNWLKGGSEWTNEGILKNRMMCIWKILDQTSRNRKRYLQPNSEYISSKEADNIR